MFPGPRTRSRALSPSAVHRHRRVNGSLSSTTVARRRPGHEAACHAFPPARVRGISVACHRLTTAARSPAGSAQASVAGGPPCGGHVHVGQRRVRRGRGIYLVVANVAPVVVNSGHGSRGHTGWVAEHSAPVVGDRRIGARAAWMRRYRGRPSARRWPRSRSPDARCGACGRAAC